MSRIAKLIGFALVPIIMVGVLRGTTGTDANACTDGNRYAGADSDSHSGADAHSSADGDTYPTANANADTGGAHVDSFIGQKRPGAGLRD